MPSSIGCQRHSPDDETRDGQRATDIAGRSPTVARRDGNPAEPGPQRIGHVECGVIKSRGEALRVSGDVHQPGLQHGAQGAPQAYGEHVECHGPRVHGCQGIQHQRHCGPNQQDSGSGHQRPVRKSRYDQVARRHPHSKGGQNEGHVSSRHQRYRHESRGEIGVHREEAAKADCTYG